ncbi:uncharacterized protein LOC116196546 [Punica granatum]|uniref:DUF4283 domain-containing protein n=2 Tax=Punica granatum TaxID=22663 RepID=A0A2I0L4T4_PUNGR|nr:uncharacterized protein LOC116196546 [Punica granatum]PKI75721.1 hypothetical protein CRG98_003864 [Punica granatum]
MMLWKLISLCPCAAAEDIEWEEPDPSDVEEDFSNDDDDVCPNIEFTKEEIKSFRAPWWGSLLLKVLGRRVGYMYLRKRLESLWRPERRHVAVSFGSDYFLVKFEHLEDRRFARTEGPRMVLGHYLTVHPSVPDFDPQEVQIDRTAVWLHIPKFPMEYYNEVCLRRIANRLEKIAKIDFNTKADEKGKFARLCVEVNLNRWLRAKFRIRGKPFLVEYEGIHSVCFGCGR